MNTGTPASNSAARRNSHQPGPRAPGGRGYAKLVTTGLLAATGLIGSRRALWLAMAAMLVIVIALAMLQGAPPVQAAAGDATGQPGIVDQANTGVALGTVRPDMTLLAETSGIMDPDDLTNPGWTYQWKHVDAEDNETDISGATSATYLVTESDIGKAFRVSVTFTDDATNTEGPLTSSSTRFVGPKGLIVWNTKRDRTLSSNIALTATTTKLAQRFTSGSAAETYTLDYVELTFGTIGDTATAGSGISVTLNEDSSGSPGGILCPLTNPTTFSSSGAHKFRAGEATISSHCPQLVSNSAYHVVIEKKSSYTATLSLTHDFRKTTGTGSSLAWGISDPSEQYASSAWSDVAINNAMLIDVRARLTEFELAEITETEVPFGWALTPTGVTGGQKFRLLFLTDDEGAPPPPTSTSTTPTSRPRPPPATPTSRSTPASSGSWAAPPTMTPATTPRRRPQTPTHLSTG